MMQMTRMGAVLAVGLAGCATIGLRQLTAEQEQYAAQLASESTTVEIPTSEAAEAWGRAQSFIGKYSSMKIQVATDYILETHNPDCHQFGYSVTRTPKGTKTEFTVSCVIGVLPFMATVCSPTSEDQAAKLNAKALARYIRTGQLEHPELLGK